MDSMSGKLVVLRAPRDEDCEFMAALRNDLRTQAWNQRIAPCVMPNRIQERMREGLKRPNTGLFIVETKDQERVGYVNYEEGTPRLSATIGISTLEDFWGKGHAMEALEILLRFLFEERGLMVVRAWTQSGNVRAVKGAEKMGFKKSARIRESAIIDGQLHDTLMMDLLREEYYMSRGTEDRMAGLLGDRGVR